MQCGLSTDSAAAGQQAAIGSGLAAMAERDGVAAIHGAVSPTAPSSVINHLMGMGLWRSRHAPGPTLRSPAGGGGRHRGSDRLSGGLLGLSRWPVPPPAHDAGVAAR